MKVIYLHTEEKELIEQAVESNRHAQHQIYSKFSPKMLGVCRQIHQRFLFGSSVMKISWMPEVLLALPIW